MCDVIHIRNKKGTDDEVYIGRGSVWGNPYKIGQDGTRGQAITKYVILMSDRLKENEELWKARLKSLKGKTLVCFCKPKACHGDVLKQLVMGI